MARFIDELKRTHLCGQLRAGDIGREVVLFGWTLQLAMGIAFWILPRFSHEPRYGNQAFGWLLPLLGGPFRTTSLHLLAAWLVEISVESGNSAE